MVDPAHAQEMLLGLLADAGDAYTPGEVLSGKLGLPPAVVLRLVDGLRADGYRIDSLGRRGYRLVSVPDRLSALEVGTFLTTHDVGREIHHREIVASTNDLAYQLGREGAFHGETVLAEAQERGKGRRGRTWVSPPRQNIYCSVVLRPPVPPVRAPELTFVAAVALAQTLRDAFGVPATIKWPNDVEIDGRKVAGILTELDVDAGRVAFAVLGIGLNVNMPLEVLPDDVRDRATSLRAELGQPVDRPLVVAALLGRLETWYDRWLAEGFEPVRAAWRGLTSTLGRQVRVAGGGTRPELVGVAEELDPTGALLVRSARGLERVVAGDVEHLRTL